MNLDEIKEAEDKRVLAIPEIALMMSSKCRKTPLSFAEVRTLVSALLPGKARQANLERYGLGWRLRFFLYDESSGVWRRRSFVIENPEIKQWVEDFLVDARRSIRKHKYDLLLRDLIDRIKSPHEITVEMFNARFRELHVLANE